MKYLHTEARQYMYPVYDGTAKHAHAVRVLDRRQPMRDGDRRPALRRLVQRLLHDLLRVGVERRGGLVKQQHPRVAQQRTRDGDTFYKTFRHEKMKNTSTARDVRF